MSTSERAGHRRPMAGWSERIRDAPLGVLVAASVIFFLGCGMVLGGFYLAISRREAGWMPWVMAGLIGPVTLYLSLHLLRLTAWAWLTLVAVLLLLVGSSVLRLLGSPESWVSTVVEIAAEALFLFYLARRPIRQAFGWS